MHVIHQALATYLIGYLKDSRSLCLLSPLPIQRHIIPNNKQDNLLLGKGSWKGTLYSKEEGLLSILDVLEANHVAWTRYVISSSIKKLELNAIDPNTKTLVILYQKKSCILSKRPYTCQGRHLLTLMYTPNRKESIHTSQAIMIKVTFNLSMNM